MKIKNKLSLLPTNPGCYLMKDIKGTIIYVGKAKNLKNRVKSYFTGAHNLKTTKLVSEINDFDIVVTNSEQESLILELNLIKEHRPKYNIVFMDDKTYPFIEVIDGDNPQIKVVRTKNVKGRIFGPYPNVISARETARFLELLFPMGREEKVPNFYEEIGNKIVSENNDDYKKQLDKIYRFLKGDIKEVVDALVDAMNYYSEIMMFERAAIIRDQIEHIKNTTEKQIISLNDFKDRDVIGIAYNDEDLAIQILFMRNGRVVDQHQNVFAFVGSPQEFALSYLIQFYEVNQPDELLFSNMFDNEDLTIMKNAIIPKKGDKKKIVDLATKNAKMDLENYNQLYRNKHEKKNQVIDKVKALIGLESIDLIETFDNSQLFGTAPISAMIVFEKGDFNKKKYRKYHLKGTNVDDYAAMQEVIYRRYQKVLLEKLPIPNLVLVDGGKGQVNIAEEVLKQLNLEVMVLGLKKNNKHQLENLIYQDKELIISDDKDIYTFFSKISEEVHRYAITFHRTTRKKHAYSSIFDKVKGLGPKRKKALLKTYNNIEDVYNATEEEMNKIGIPKAVYENIKEVLKSEISNQES